MAIIKRRTKMRATPVGKRFKASKTTQAVLKKPQLGAVMKRPQSVLVYVKRTYDVSTTSLTGNVTLGIYTDNISGITELSDYFNLYHNYRVRSIKVQWVPSPSMVNPDTATYTPFRYGSPWRICSTNDPAASATNYNTYAENVTTALKPLNYGWTKVWTNDLRAGRDQYIASSSYTNIGGVIAYMDGESSVTPGGYQAGSVLETYVLEFNSEN